MRNWLVNANSSRVTANFDGKSFILSARRRPRIAAGDRLIFLSGKPASFKYFATVDGVDLSEVESLFAVTGSPTDASEITYFLSGLHRIENALSLEEARFSLTVVRNTVKPWVHFRGAYRLLPSGDFEALQKGESFVARTGYFEFLNSLPPKLVKTFHAEQALMPEAETFLERLKRLHEFLDERVFAAGRLLVAIKAATESLQLRSRGNSAGVRHEFDIDSAGATGEIARSADDLDVQVERFNRLLGLLESPDESDVESKAEAVSLVIQIVQDANENQIQRRFEATFRRLR